MDRATIMAARVFVPTGMALLVAAGLAFAGSGLSEQPMLRGIATEWAVFVDVALAAALVLAVHAVFCLWRWEQGRTPDCPAAGACSAGSAMDNMAPTENALAAARTSPASTTLDEGSI